MTFEEDIYRSSVVGGAAERLTSTRDATSPVWGPGRIAYSGFEDDPLTAHFFNEVWEMRPDGSRQRRLGQSDQLRAFEWSQGGGRLLGAYSSVVSSVPVAVARRTRQRPIGRFGAEAYTTGFSKDGRFVLVWDRGDLVRVPGDGAGREVLVRNVDEVADWNL